MASPLFDECAETRMFRALSEISARIPEESDVARMQAGMGLSLVPREVS